MPRKADWIHRIPNALRTLEQASSAPPLLDRRDIERLLEVSPRHAVRILTRLGASEVGKNLFIESNDFQSRLRALYAGEDTRYERRRLVRLAEALTAVERDLKARQVPVRASPQAWHLRFPALPESVRLRPGRLEVDFSSPEELLTRLFELSQAIANDYEAFAAAAEVASAPGNHAER